ncbi:MAG: single-stranded-DNA-specific exonuclease RecJ [Halieaceae bacterium]
MPQLIRRRAPVTEQLSASGINPVLARIFASRGIGDAFELSLGLDQLLPPAGFAGLDAAAVLLADSLEAGESILIVGDFDADGATSTAVAMTLLRAMGAVAVDYLVPNRFEYGYGLTPEIVELAEQRSPGLIVTVDNGISSLDGVQRARELGIKTLITDHHLPGRTLPGADVIVNPNQPGCYFPSKSLAGVGVIFYVMSGLRSELRRRGWFEQQGLAEPALGEVLDLVALGTVADVVPLDRNNRILVQQGLLRMRAGRTRPGLRALLEIASRPLQRVVASDLSFAVGPRLNAAGRLDDMSVGIACLLAEDEHSARQLAERLDAFNRDRQSIEKSMQAEAKGLIDQLLRDVSDDKVPTTPNSICLYEPGWHQGVVGILASRIKDRLHRPAIAFADGDGGGIKGSARSIPGLHIRDVLDRVATCNPGLVSKFGGHAMAAGLSLRADDFERFRQAFDAEVSLWLDDVELQSIVESDGELGGADLDLLLARELRYAAPWGQHFPEPVFDGEFDLVHQRIVGERHLKLVLSHPDNPAEMLDAIAFNVDLEQWPDPAIEKVRLAYRLDCNYFRGQERLQLMVEVLEALS